MNAKTWIRLTVAVAFLGGTAPLASFAAAQEDGIPIGHLATATGDTASVASSYAQGITDSLRYINMQGGIEGRPLVYETVDYGYDALRAVATYARWREELKPVMIFGWGTADTEALVQFVARDEIVFFSGSSSGHLTDPTGRSEETTTPAPYNFFYGPSYSDGCRGLVQWAAEDWRRSEGRNVSSFLRDLSKPKFVHMGDNHPYPNSPKRACESYARDLGFEVLPTIRYPLAPGNFKAYCEALKQSGAGYAFLANTADSNVALVKDCAEVGVTVQFMTNIYGWDRNAIEAAGGAGNGMVWVVTVTPWGMPVDGMALLRKVSALSAPDDGETQRSLHYVRGVCTAFLGRDALTEAAGMDGGITGANVKKALESMRNHVPEGLDGVCLPTTYSSTDHRGSTEVSLYQSNFANQQVSMYQIYETTLPLRPDWLGW